MDYHIISTGSKGNCVVIGNVMVDCGVAFKKIKDFLYDVDVLLLTHIHSDHIKESTLKNIVVMFPHIKIYGNYEVCQVFGEYPITAVNEGVEFYTHTNQTVTPFKCIHDVLTYGYYWEHFTGESIIYATDTSDLRNAPTDMKFDYLFLEANHDEKKVEQLLHASGKFGYNAYAGAKRHMSTQKAKSYYYVNRKSKESKLIELHMSSRFY
jgi:phosphoribosyl 1,2-cyclic phosphodiesterase